MADQDASGESPEKSEAPVMTPDLQFSVLCDDVRQEINGKLILIGLFEAIRAKTFPVRHPVLFIVNRWRNGDGTFRELTRLVSATNEKVVEGPEARFSLPGTHTSHTVIHRFPNILFETPGTYWVEIQLDGQLHHRYPIRLVGEDQSD
jgi:hypothetical protein